MQENLCYGLFLALTFAAMLLPDWQPFYRLLREVAGAQGSVWVVGLIRGQAADTAGVRQGDEIVAVDERPTEGLSPFQVASLILGASTGDASTSGMQRSPTLSLAVRSALTILHN